MPEKASLKWAEEALLEGRTPFKEYGSSNKLSAGKTKNNQDRKKRREQAARQLGDLKTYLDKYLPMIKTDAKSTSGAAQIAKHARDKGAGNCTEMSAQAYVWLYREQVRPLYWLALEDPGDHMLVALGEIGNDVANIANWGDEVFICDPWAKIACNAKDYKTNWMSKMKYWSEKTDTTTNQPNPKWLFSEIQNQFVDPLCDEWHLAIGTHKFEVWASAFEVDDQ